MNWDISANFPPQEPNDCNFNFIQIFDEKRLTDADHLKKEYCGSVADQLQSESDTVYLR